MADAVIEAVAKAECAPTRHRGWPRSARARGARAFDCAVALCALPSLALVAVLLLAVNPWLNRGPLLFTQTRMGRHGRPFRLHKFRSMRPLARLRRYDAPLERDAITPLGRFIRHRRIDELPQVINVLRGEMSIIGPRPDAYEHARAFCAAVPGYAQRHAVRPGITGLAQVTGGYAEGLAATAEKVRADLHYVGARSVRLDAWILWRTIFTVARPGAMPGAAAPDAGDGGAHGPAARTH